MNANLEDKIIKIKNLLVKLEIDDVEPIKLLPAFTHPSFRGIALEAEVYERWEFLGDSVLDLICADILIRERVLSEGEMTEKRKLDVNNENLSCMFDILGLDSLVRASIDYKLSMKDKANIIEAFLGGIFLNKGYDVSKSVWNYMKKQYLLQKPPESENLEINKVGLGITNAKNMLQEFCQKQGLPIPTYSLIEREGSDHNPIFKVKVLAYININEPDKESSALGIGKTKKEAEKTAAEKLCDEICLEYTSV